MRSHKAIGVVLEQPDAGKQEVEDVSDRRDTERTHQDHCDLAPDGSLPDLVDVPSEFPQPYLEPVEKAGCRKDLAGQDHQSDEDRSPAGTGQGGEDQAAEGDDGAEGDQEYPPYDVALFVPPPPAVTVLETLSWLALPELPPVLLYLLEHI